MVVGITVVLGIALGIVSDCGGAVVAIEGLVGEAAGHVEGSGSGVVGICW